MNARAGRAAELSRPIGSGWQWRDGAMALFLLLAAGCSHLSPFRAIERSVRAELPRLIGPADRYQGRVSRSESGLLAGRIPWIEIRGDDVRVIAGLNLDWLKVRLEGVRFDRAGHTVREVEQTQFEAQVGARSVVAFLHARHPDLRGVRVRFARGEVWVRATPELLGIGVPVEVAGRPVLHGATRLDFEASRVSVLSLGLPEFAVHRLEARVDPLVDLAALPFPVRLSGVRIDGGGVVLDGTALLTPTQFKQ